MAKLKIHEILRSFTRESFEEVNAITKTGFSNRDFLPAGMEEDHIFAIQMLQYIKAAPWFLKHYGDTLCVIENKSKQNFIKVDFEAIRKGVDRVVYNEDGEIIDNARLPENQFCPEDWPDIAEKQIHEFFRWFNLDSLEIARKNIQDGIISEEEWISAERLLVKYAKLNKVAKSLKTQDVQFSHEEELPQMLIEAASEINKLVEDGDVVIFVGNTPQMIRYPFDKMMSESKPDLITVSLGISGHPGVAMNRGFSITNILTDEQHELYKIYMQDMGLTTEFVHGKKIHFVDVINSGGGIAYLMKCIAEIAYGGDISEAQQYFHAINIENSHGFLGAIKGQKFIYCDIETSASVLDDSKNLSRILDAVRNDYEEFRLMPDCKSYKWSPDFIDRLTEISRDIFGHAGEIFRPIFAEVDTILVSSVVAVEDAELEDAHHADTEGVLDQAPESLDADPSVDLAGVNGPAAEVEGA